MRVLELFYYGDVIKLDVEVLVDAFQCTAQLDIVLELYSDLMVYQGLEEAMWHEFCQPITQCEVAHEMHTDLKKSMMAELAFETARLVWSRPDGDTFRRAFL